MSFIEFYLDYKKYKANVSEEQSFYKPILIRRMLKDDFYYISSYIKTMRYVAFWSKYNGIIPLIFKYWNIRKLYYFRRKTSLEIHPMSCDWGIKIWHRGTIIINNDARIGKNLTIFPGCIIGQKEDGEVPTLGDNVYMGAGSKVFGKINIGDNVIIAPNSVVTHDVPSNTTVGGIPAKVIGGYKTYKWQ